MFTIKDTQNTSGQLIEVILENTNKTSSAKIALHLGGSLQELTLNRKPIIEDLHPLKYKDTYASSILFPFANRIKDGTYTFEGKPYKLDTNLEIENNALHGLVYNKYFKPTNNIVTDTYASVTLLYEETEKHKGFPYTYSIQLIYTLTQNSLSLKVIVTNTCQDAFPYTIGWHPYFTCSDLYNSHLEFDSNKTLVFDSRNITTGIKDFYESAHFEIKDKKLDDCFFLNSSPVKFISPGYELHINSSSNNSFLQVYTPNRLNTIAIEPTTGVSDSFNNNIGLSVLKPNETYEITWTIELSN